MGFQVGGSSSNQSGSGTSTPVIPSEWQGAYDKLLGNGAVSPEQKDSSAFFRDVLASGGANPKLGAIYDQFLSPLMQKGAVTLGGLNDSGNPNYTTPTMNLMAPPPAAQSIGAAGVQAPSASQFLGQYNAPVEDAISASMADMLHSGDIAQNDLRARYGGTPGGGREQVYAGQQAADTARAIGNMAAQTRLQGYQTNLGAATGDASRTLGASQGNQATDLSTNTTNATLAQQAAQQAADRNLQAQEFMANLISGRQTTDVNSANLNTDQKLQAINAGQGNVETQGGNVNQQIGQYGASGGTAVQQMLAALGLGTSTFGKNTTSTQSGSQVGASAGGK